MNDTERARELEGFNAADAIRTFVWPAICRIEDGLSLFMTTAAFEDFRVREFVPLKEIVEHLSARLSDEQVVKLDRAERRHESSAFKRWLLPIIVTVAIFAVQLADTLFIDH